MNRSIDNSARSSEQLTTTAGNPIADNQNSLSAGPRGPLLLQDYQLLEKLAHQNRERTGNDLTDGPLLMNPEGLAQSPLENLPGAALRQLAC
jgi:hypothetical protein